MNLSLVIPTIGSSKRSFLKEAIDSALKTSPKIVNEIIIIDNAKSSGFNNHLSSLIKKDHRFIIHKMDKQMTMAQCWNEGLSKVTNPWHLYLHDDDILLPKQINGLQIKSFQQVGFISFDFQLLTYNQIKRVHRKAGLDGILHNTPKFVSTIFSTSAIREIGPWDEDAGYFLDLLAFMKLHEMFGSAHIEKVLGTYRIHEENASSIEGREAHYADSIPYLLGHLFTLFKAPDQRKKTLLHILNFTYPSLSSKVAKKILSLSGKKLWLAN